MSSQQSRGGRGQRRPWQQRGQSGGATGGGDQDNRPQQRSDNYQRTQRGGASGQWGSARGANFRPYRSSGDGRGRSRGRGNASLRRDSPVRTDVRQLAKTVEILPKFREQKGIIGTPVVLITNHFEAKHSIDSVFHYDIEIKLRRNDGKTTDRPEPKRVGIDKQLENKKIIARMAEEWPLSGLRPNSYAYDGHKNIFTVDKLDIGSEQVTREVTVTLDGFPEQTYGVNIKLVRTVLMDVFNTSDEFADVRQVMDIVLRHPMQQSMVGVGRNFFNRNPENTIQLDDDNCSIGFGHHQSIKKTESGLNVIVDRVTTLFRGDGLLLEFIRNELRVDDIRHIIFTEEIVSELTPRLRGLKIYTNHIMGQKRKYVIESMTNKKPNEHRFEYNTEPGLFHTIDEYFGSKYGIALKHKSVPLIKIKGGTIENPRYLPPEVCHVYPNQSMPNPLISGALKAQIVESTNKQTPLKRFEKNQMSLNKIRTESQELMQTFGLEIRPEPIKLTARELPGPKLRGSAKHLNQPKDLKNGLFLNLSPEVENDLDNFFKNFFDLGDNNLRSTAKSMGMTINLPKIIGQTLDISYRQNQINAFENIVKDVKQKYPSAQLIFVCIPDDSVLHSVIKYYSEIVYGVITQCIKDKLLLKTKKGYFNNFLLKTNAKLGGQNLALAPNQELFRPKMLTNQSSNTMIIGADVTHPGFHNPLAKEKVISSIAALVGSYDMDFTKFMATVSAVGMNCEYITDFGLMFETLIKEFHKNNGKYPQNIIFFRDGVSDSQMDSVSNGEIPQIEEVFKRLNLPEPKITAFVVQKRHHTRFLRDEPTIEWNKTQNYNMKSGTVVDHTVINPDVNEFHLCSHTGILGTSRHAKYVVIRNDHNLRSDSLHLLSYSMCFTYCRCATPISIPIPVKYADLAAYRAKQYTTAQNTIYEMGDPNETAEQKRQREVHNIRLLNKSMVVHQNLKFLPYYC